MPSTNIKTRIGQFQQPSTTATFDAVSANAFYLNGVALSSSGGGGTVGAAGVPYVGATANVNLGSFSLTANTISANNIVNQIIAGTDISVSPAGGVGNVTVNAIGTKGVPYTGATANVDLGSFSLTANTISANNIVNRIIAGSNIGVTPVGGTGDVTVSADIVLTTLIPYPVTAYNTFFVHPSFTGTNTAYNYYNSISAANNAYVTGASGCIFVYAHPITYQESFSLKEGVKMKGLGSSRVSVSGSISTTNFFSIYQVLEVENFHFALSGGDAFVLGSGDYSDSISSIARFKRCKFKGN